MPDLGPLVSGLADLFGPLLKRALGSFLMTGLGALVLGAIAAGVAWSIASPGSTLHGVLAALLVVVLFGVVGVVLSTKRAIASALVLGVQKLGLGSRTCGLVFERLLAVEEEKPMGERGGVAAKLVERTLPLAQAEAKLSAVIRSLVQTKPPGSGMRAWLGRRIQAALLALVERITLSRFREESVQRGGVDLVLVRDELAGRIDGLIAEKVQGTANRLTALVTVGASAGAVALAYAIRALPF